MKTKLLELKEEFISRWKDIMVLLLCCIEEVFLFSSLTTRLPIPVTVVVNVVLISSVVTFFILALKDKKCDKKDLKRFLIFVLLSLLFGVIRSYLYIASLLIAYIFLDNKERLFKWIFTISTACFTIYVILVILSIIPDTPILRINEGTITNIRHSFGFNHPNQPLKFYGTMIISGYLWLAKSTKSTLLFSIIMLFPAYFLGHNTNSRTGLIISIFILISMNLPIIFSFIKVKWLYLLFTFATLGLVISYQLKLDFINEALSGRPWWFNEYFKNYGEFVIFGKCYYPLLINMLNYPLDNGFMYILFDGGIFALIAINILFYKSFKNTKDVRITTAVFAVLTYSLTESLCTIFTNLLYVMMFCELLSNYYKNKEKSIEVKVNESIN